MSDKAEENLGNKMPAEEEKVPEMSPEDQAA
jgi:hypothetical protein